MAFCNKCGTQLNDGSKFCAACGNPQGEVKTAKTAGAGFSSAFPYLNFNSFIYLGYALVSFILLFANVFSAKVADYSFKFSIFNLLPETALDGRGMFIFTMVLAILTIIVFLGMVFLKLINFNKLNPSAPKIMANLGGIAYYGMYLFTLFFAFLAAITEEAYAVNIKLSFSWFLCFFIVIGGLVITFVPKIIDIFPKLFKSSKE